MNLDILFTPEKPISHYDEKLNHLMLNQMVLSAIEEDDNKFNYYLGKTVDYLSPYTPIEVYELSLDSNSNGVDGSVDVTNNYYSFMHFAVAHFSEKYSLQITQKALYEDKERYTQKNLVDKNSQLITYCILGQKKENLKLLLNSDFIKESDIYQTIFLTNYKELKQNAHQIIYHDDEVFFNLLNSSLNNDIPGRHLKNVLFALTSIYKIYADTLDKKNKIKDSFIPYIIELKNKFVNSRDIKAFTNDLFINDIFDEQDVTKNNETIISEIGYGQSEIEELIKKRTEKRATNLDILLSKQKSGKSKQKL